MDKFPKKYDYKKLIKVEQKKEWTPIISPFIPMDQKVNPGIMYSLFYKEMLVGWWNILWEKKYTENWFWLSSQFYSNLNKWKISQKDLWKKIKDNKSFLKKIWISCEDDEKQIFSEEYNRYCRKVFWNLYEKKIFTQKETVFWSKDLQTNFQPTNIKKIKKDVVEYTLKYFIWSKWIALQVATTNIETIFADVAVAVNPNDKRYRKFLWQTVIIPIINREIPIIADESVDIFEWSWVKRVTPWHDAWSLTIAQKNNLPVDVFSIDINGTFTENAWIFAWKSLDDFYDNIETYIDDIWNLESKRIVPWVEYVSSYSGEVLYPITLDQWNISHDYALDYLSQIISDDIIKFQNKEKWEILDLLDQKNSICISNKTIKWLLIPVVYDNQWNSFVINDETVVEKYSEKKSRKSISLTLIISNLILDWLLPEKFTIEELIDVLFSMDFLWNCSKLEKYIRIYDNENSQYRDGLKALKSFSESVAKDVEKVNILSEILEDSFAISQEWDYYFIDYSQIFGVESLMLQTNDCFNKNFLDSVWFCFRYNLEYSDDSYLSINKFNNEICVIDWDKHLLLSALLLWLEYGKTLLFSSVIFHESLVDLKWNRITNFNSKYYTQDLYENLNKYWPDVLRLNLLFGDEYQDSWNYIFDTDQANDYNLALNKIWNANRYIYTKFIEPWSKIKVENLVHAITKEISDCDSRLLHQIKIFLEEIQDLLSMRDYIKVWKKIFVFYRDVLCWKYLESSKISFSTNTPFVILLSFAIFSKLIWPYIPIFAENLQMKFNFDRDGCELFDINKIELAEINYKTKVFMDIIDAFLALRKNNNIKKHEHTDLYIQANPDFLDFLQENDLLVRSLINVWDINYISIHSELPQWYLVWSVININLWMKKIDKVVTTSKWMLKELEQEYNDKMEHLQHLKSVLSRAYATCPADIIAKKKDDIAMLQQEIEDLQINIWRLKSRK